MKSQKVLFKFITVVISFYLISIVSVAQETFEQTIDVHGSAIDWSYLTGSGIIDEFTIINAIGINWLRISDQPFGAEWELAYRNMYDGPPIIGQTVKTVKRPPPCEGCGWEATAKLWGAAVGEGSLTIRYKIVHGDEPYPIEGEYLNYTDYTQGNLWGNIVANPSSIQPGNTTNIEVTIPARVRRLISGVVLIIPGAGWIGTNPERVTLPFDIDGVYNYSWTLPFDKSYSNVGYEAYSINLLNGQPKLLLRGVAFLNVASILSVEMSLQGKEVPDGSNNTWDNFRNRSVSVRIGGGKGPFKTKWIVNSQEVKPSSELFPESNIRTLEDQNVLANAASITCEVTDANGNKASGTFYVGVKTNITFDFMVQGVKVENGSTVNWREEASKIITVNSIYVGKTPFLIKWFINNIEVASRSITQRFDQFTDREALEKASSVSIELTDANGVVSKFGINIGNPGDKPDVAVIPTGPVGSAPVPPPLTGDPGMKPNPDIDWNNKPWLDAKVQVCTREYLQKIVLYMENEIRKWENSGLAESKKNALFTSIDDWGRLLNQFITATGGVDGNWDNPTHYVWSAYNKPSSASRYGRTVEYYVKYECGASQPSPDDIDNAINNLSNDSENTKWDKQKVKAAQNNLNNLLDLARSLYNKFLVNYYKFNKEINDQNSNPLENEIIALCIASADGQLNEHTVNKDSLEVTGNALISQSATNKDIIMFDIIRVMSEVQVQSDDMNKKMSEMRNLLAARGGDIEQIITNGQHLIAQGNVNPEFAQDGGVNVEFAGDGIDNIGNGLQDFLYGNVRRGNVLIVIWDAGNVIDDIFEVSISGRGSMGTTPPGGRRNFDITLNPGTYSLTIRGVYTDPNWPPCTYGIEVYDQDKLILQEALISIEEKQEATYSITIR
jgi:hypothetical protein